MFLLIILFACHNSLKGIIYYAHFGWLVLVTKSCPILVTPWTIARQALLSTGFPRQEYWSGLLFPPGSLPDPGIEPGSPALQAYSLPIEPPGKPTFRAAENEAQK